MTTLFATDDPLAPALPPSEPTLAALEALGYRRDVVGKWTQEKAFTVLRSRQKKETVALRKAQAKAAAVDNPPERGQPTPLERKSAADCVEQASRVGIDELFLCLSSALYAMSDAELRELATTVVGQYRGRPVREAVA